MKFLLVAAACLALAVAGPTRSVLDVETGPVIKEEDIAIGPAIIPEDISVGPAFIPEDIANEPAIIDDSIAQKSPLVQVIINIDSKSHVVEIPIEDANVPEESEIKPDPVDVIESEPISIGKPEVPPKPSPVEIGRPELPELEADNAQNIPDELN